MHTSKTFGTTRDKLLDIISSLTLIEFLELRKPFYSFYAVSEV